MTEIMPHSEKNLNLFYWMTLWRYYLSLYEKLLQSKK